MWNDNDRYGKTPFSKNNSMADDIFFGFKMALPVFKWIAKILLHPLARFFWLACIGIETIYMIIRIFTGGSGYGEGILFLALATGMFCLTNRKNKLSKNEKQSTESQKDYPNSNIQQHQFIEPTTQTHTIEPYQQELLEQYEQYKNQNSK